MSIKVREAHWQILVEEMEKNPVIATGKFVGPRGKEYYKKSWNETARKLNALGFGSKSTEKWQKTWADYKYNLKKKAAAGKKSISQTGRGPTEEKDLTESKLKLLDSLGKSFMGLEDPECGLPASSQLNIFEDPQPGTSRDEPAPSPHFNIIEEPQPETSKDEPTSVILTPTKIVIRLSMVPLWCTSCINIQQRSTLGLPDLMSKISESPFRRNLKFGFLYVNLPIDEKVK